MRLPDTLKAYARVSRIEYIPLEAPGVLVPLFLGAGSVGELWSVQVAEAIAVLWLAFAAGFMTNSLADLEVDSRYKTFVSDAVRHLGRKTVLGLIGAHIALALATAAHLGHHFKSPWLLPWVVAGLAIALGYSVKPLHLKVRGLLQPLHNVFSLIMLCLVYYVVGGKPPTPVVLVFVGLLLAHYGIELVNQAGDYLEDRESGLTTPAVLYGITPTLVTSLAATVAGLVLAAVGFYPLLSELPEASLAGRTFTFRTLAGVFPVIVAVAYSRTLRGTWALIRISLRSSSDEHMASVIKERLDYPKWQLPGVLGIALISAIYFAWKVG